MLARQPIYDQTLEVQGYELLFRASAESDAFDPSTCGDRASSDVLLNAFSALPVEDVLENKPAYVNFTRTLLNHPPPIDPERLVVEVLETIEVNSDTIAAIAALKQRGYTIALDDYFYSPDHHDLLQLADIIKVDVLATPGDTLTTLIPELQRYPARLLAEKVETHAMFSHCKQLGFELFQGYFLAKPQLVKGRRINAGQQTVLRLMAELQSKDVQFKNIEAVISTDSVLSFKLLRLVNSALFNLPRQILSIQQALTLLGIDRLRSWVTLLALSNLSDKPRILYVNAMLRARLCQQLAAVSGREDPGHAFTVGLLSTLDLFLDTPLEEVLSGVGIAPGLTEAILQRRGTAGLFLDTAIQFEQANLDELPWPRLQAEGLEEVLLNRVYVESLRWARESVAELM